MNEGWVQQAQAALDADAEIQRYNVKVKNENGRMVLTGIVDVMSDEHRAMELVSRTLGDVPIENAMTVSTDGKVDDEEVAFEVEEELSADPRVDLRQVGTVVRDGVVYLQGTIQTSDQEEAAVEAAARARGVKAVISHLKLEEEESS